MSSEAAGGDIFSVEHNRRAEHTRMDNPRTTSPPFDLTAARTVLRDLTEGATTYGSRPFLSLSSPVLATLLALNEMDIQNLRWNPVARQWERMATPEWERRRARATWDAARNAVLAVPPSAPAEQERPWAGTLPNDFAPDAPGASPSLASLLSRQPVEPGPAPRPQVLPFAPVQQASPAPTTPVLPFPARPAALDRPVQGQPQTSAPAYVPHTPQQLASNNPAARQNQIATYLRRRAELAQSGSFRGRNEQVFTPGQKVRDSRGNVLTVMPDGSFQ